MTWFKIDDGWHKHRKRIRAGLDLEGLAAHGLWADAGSWSGDELTDGWVPDDVLTYLSPGISKKIREKLVGKLVAAELWTRAERNGETGIQFHDWEARNPTREQVMAEREAAAQRQRNARDRAKQTRQASQGESRRESRRDIHVTHAVTTPVTHGVSNGVSHSPPTRPDPTRPELPSGVQKPPGVDLRTDVAEIQKKSGIEDQTPETPVRRNTKCPEHWQDPIDKCLPCSQDRGDWAYWTHHDFAASGVAPR